MHRQDQDPQTAFLVLFAQVEGDLRAFIRSVVRNAVDGDDVLQETAQVLWRRFPTYDPARPFGAWARRIASIEILRHRDRSRRQPVPLPPESLADLETGDSPGDPSLLLEALADTLAQLTAAQRNLLVLHYREGLTLSEIAHRQGLSSEAVAKAIQRLRSALGAGIRRRMADHG